MSDDSDLLRAFAQAPDLPDDDAFVTAVGQRIVWRQRRNTVTLAIAAVLFLLVLSALWPMASEINLPVGDVRAALAGVDAFFHSQLGMITAAALLGAGALWSTLYRELRGL